MSQKKVIRIGNAGGYWGDDPNALERQVQGGRLDYISMDFLAEITMSILQKQRSTDPEMGYAKDFLGMLKGVLPKLMADKTTVITNAGGVNPQSCARAIAKLAAELGLQPRIAIVYGDDILPDIKDLQSKGCKFANMENGEDFATVQNKIQAANIYFGAAPVVEALKWNPDIIVTGRVTDTGITIAAMIHEFNWKLNDWDRLASGIVAGHIIECGSQSTGGNFSDWEKVPSFDNIGYPIVEVNEDGSFVVTKHVGSGGMVTVDTVREQLFYEMGHPEAYITPDVVANFSSIQLAQDGQDRVRVFGVKGFEPTPLYKVSMAYEDGYKSIGSIMISGPNARRKAEAFSEIFWKRCPGPFIETLTEYVGFNACHRSLIHRDDGNEILLRLGARATDEKDLRLFGKMIPSLILSGPPGVAVIGGVPKAQKVMSYWPALMPKDIVHPRIALYEKGEITSEKTVTTTPVGHYAPTEAKAQVASKASKPIADVIKEYQGEQLQPLSRICLARSGDKGDMANIGVMARSQAAYEFLDKYLTAQRVKDLFQELCHGTVTRHSLPNMQGFNFLLDQALGGGGTMTLRIDAQGKTFAQGLIAQRVALPQNLLS
ncbi:MAG TPA: acyclic terpene utilization AtuA family protein [Oligoflexus sp.]|uniref:acyclic terpene utilization AtuA family protein n=1 Tax=Oligoflexus sp. TaxID=1971216 RepID=UPI002D45E0D9|nr:acyclic terpene utilization AtuA family protein [Oligoflexus sp.]HYX35565.1 acyclic terpene utilization AtuA family protein [Oligoflexus sp.]